MKYFPNITHDLKVAGAPTLDFGLESHIRFPYGFVTRHKSDIIIYSCSRPLLEWQIHQYVKENEKITILEGCKCAGLLSNTSQTTVTGVQFHSSPASGKQFSEEMKTLQADLIVDASGRETQSPAWLETLGYKAPEVIIINSHLGYASCDYRPSADIDYDWKLLASAPVCPTNPKGGAIYQIENGLWKVLLVGMGGDYPPTDEAGYLDFARQLETPKLYEALKRAELISPIYSYRRTANQWREIEKLSHWPENFVMVGDAVCGFNPYYGQGITAGVMGAERLDKTLKQHYAQHPDRSLLGMSHQFQKDIAEQNKIPWMMATGSDIQWPHTEGGDTVGLADKIAQQYLDLALKTAPKEEDVTQAFYEVQHMVAHPTILFHPKIMSKIVKNQLSQVPRLNIIAKVLGAFIISRIVVGLIKKIRSK